MRLLCFLWLQSPIEIERFQKQAADPDPAVRARAIDLLARHKSLAAARLTAPLLGADHPRVRYHALLALAAVPDPELVDILCDRIRNFSGGRSEALQVLGRLRHPRAVEPLLEFLNHPGTRAEAARALGAIGRLDTADAISSMPAKTAEEKVAQLDALELLDLERAAAAARERLSDPAPEARLRAVQILARHGTLPAHLPPDPDWRVSLQRIESWFELKRVAPLIDALEKESGRLRHDGSAFLQRLTGKNFSTPKAWKEWWREAESGFEPALAPVGAGRTELEFFQVPVDSNRPAFVIDFSGSMREPAGGFTKIDVVRRELIGTVERLPKESAFTIIPMSCDDRGRGRPPWSEGLRPATETNKALAAAFLNREAARGYTNLYDALLAALDSGADTVFLYSDGGASRGTFVSAEDILAHIAAANRLRKVRIHAIQLKTPQTRDWQTRLMRGLAEPTGGRHALR
jgi:hypothetical protein